MSICALCILLSSCQNSGSNAGAEGEQTADSTTIVTAASFERLDQLDFSSMKKSNTRYAEGGDCGSQLTTYDMDGLTLFIDSTDCGDYGKYFTYFLLDASGEIKMVHTKSMEPYFDDKTEKFYHAVSESIVDFNGAEPVLKSRTDTLSMDSPELKVAMDANYNSPPWIILNEPGDDFVLGKKIDYKGDWYTVSKNAIKDRLSTMSVLPKTIPMEVNGQVGMGTRGEFRSMCQEAIEEVASLKEYEMGQNVDHFKRMTKPLATVASPGEEGTLAYWKQRYRDAQEMVSE